MTSIFSWSHIAPNFAQIIRDIIGSLRSTNMSLSLERLVEGFNNANRSAFNWVRCHV